MLPRKRRFGIIKQITEDNNCFLSTQEENREASGVERLTAHNQESPVITEEVATEVRLLMRAGADTLSITLH